MIGHGERAKVAERSLVATAEITAFAAGAHVLAGGHLPSPVFLLAFSAVVFAGSVLALGRVLHVGLVTPLVLAAQVGLHASVEAAHPVHPGMAMHEQTSGFLNSSPSMFWAHAVTALVTTILLLLQERVLAAVATWLGFPTLLPDVALPRLRAVAGPAGGRLRRGLLALSPRRGPPVRLAATS